MFRLWLVYLKVRLILLGGNLMTQCTTTKDSNIINPNPSSSMFLMLALSVLKVTIWILNTGFSFSDSVCGFHWLWFWFFWNVDHSPHFLPPICYYPHDHWRQTHTYFIIIFFYLMTDESMDWWAGRRMDGQMDEWMDGWMDGQMYRWADGWMCVYCICVCIYVCVCALRCELEHACSLWLSTANCAIFTFESFRCLLKRLWLLGGLF